MELLQFPVGLFISIKSYSFSRRIETYSAKVYDELRRKGTSVCRGIVEDGRVKHAFLVHEDRLGWACSELFECVQIDSHTYTESTSAL